MSRSSFSVPVLALVAMLCSCGHTNNLAKYDMRGKPMTFTTMVSADASSTHVHIAGSNDGGMLGVASALGGMAAQESVSTKLERAAHPKELARAVGNGIRGSLVAYLDATEATSQDASSYIVETNLTNYSINSGSDGSTATLSATSRIISRSTSAIVWEDNEVRTVPLSHNYEPAASTDAMRTVTSIISAQELLKMSEEDLSKALNGAALTVGHDIGETLRIDLAELKK